MPLLAVAIPFLAPLILAPHLLFYYDITPKVALLFAGAAIALILAFRELDSLPAFCGTRGGRWYVTAVGAWLALVAIAAAAAAHPALAWDGSNWRRMGAFTQCAIILAAVGTSMWAVRSSSRVKLLLCAVCAAGLLASLYGIAQYFGWDPLLPASGYEAGEGVFQIVRPPGTLGHSDYFAAFLLWPAFGGMGLFRWNGRFRLLGAPAAAAAMIAIMLSGSRGALLALAAGLCVTGALIRPRARVLTAAVAAVVLALSIFLFSPAGQRLRARIHWIGEEPAGGARLLLWRDALRMAAAHPLTGVGPDNFVAEFPHFQSEDLARAYPDFFHESPHNALLDALTEDGALGMLALAGVAMVGIAGGWRARHSHPEPTVALLPALIATAIAHQFEVFTAVTGFYYFLGAGLLAGAGANAADAKPVSTVWRRVMLTGGLAGAALLLAQAYRLTAADFALARVQRRLDVNDPSGAAEAYRRALSHDSAGVTADLYFSRRFAAVAAGASDAFSKLYFAQLAAGAASRATGSPEQQQNAWYNFAVLLAPSNDAAAVEQALRSAIAAAPVWYKPHWSLARLLAAEGRLPEAREEAHRAAYLNDGKDPEVASTLGGILGSRGSAP